MFEIIKRYLLYSGIDHSVYRLAQKRIDQTNRSTTALISGIATVLTIVMYISTFFVKGVEANRIVYAMGTSLSFVVCILALFYAKKHTWITMPLVYLSFFIFYTYGILIGIVTDPDQKTVTFIVMLVFLPTLFIDKPVYSILTVSLYATVFICLCIKHKTGAVLQNDVIDAIIFGALGVISGIVVNRMKIQGYIFEHKLQEVSRFDQLTKMNNRNSYELCLDEIPDRSSHTLACIYIDVNGLHELNNEKGHDYGDKMLKFVADKIKQFFGEELTFRIGGDEFVVFIPDSDKNTIKGTLHRMVDTIEDEGYHVATGLELMEVHHLSMGALIRSAENRMYQNKKKFYENRTNDRRRATV